MLSKRLILLSLTLPLVLSPGYQALSAPESSNKSVVRNNYFDTAQSMYVANEEIKVFSCGLPYKSMGSAIDTSSYFYSMYNLGNLTMRSGMGLHMVHGPLVVAHAQDEPQKFPTPKDFMMFKVKQFMTRSGQTMMPKNAYPIYLPFAGGSPEFSTDPNPFDFGTLRWNPQSFDTTIRMDAVGQTMTKEILWSEDFMSAHRGNLLGRTPLDGFRAGVLTAEALNGMVALKDQLAFDGKTLGMVNPMEYDPAKGLKYFPHALSPNLVSPMKDAPPMAKSFAVKDSTSHLFDQGSLLWATSEFYFYSDPMVKDSYDKVFGDQKDHMTDGAIFPDKPHMLAKGLSAVIMKNLMAMHMDQKHMVLVSQSEPGKMGHMVSTKDSGMLATALDNVYKNFNDVPMLKEGAQKMLMAQAKFLLEHLQAPDGGFYDAYDLNTGKVSGSDRSLEAQAFGIKTLVLAYNATKNVAFKQAAEKAYQNMRAKFWVPSVNVYKGLENDKERTLLSTLSVGAVLGASRELALISPSTFKEAIVGDMTAFFNHSIQREDGLGLQVAEIDLTGEDMPESEAQLMAMREKMMKMSMKERMTMMEKMRDSDEDGVPKPMFAGGKHGMAPVLASSILLNLK